MAHTRDVFFHESKTAVMSLTNHAKVCCFHLQSTDKDTHQTSGLDSIRSWESHILIQHATIRQLLPFLLNHLLLSLSLCLFIYLFIWPTLKTLNNSFYFWCQQFCCKNTPCLNQYNLLYSLEDLWNTLADKHWDLISVHNNTLWLYSVHWR